MKILLDECVVGNSFMKRRLLTTTILILCTILFSCEGIVQGDGKVISSVDKSPIASVRIKWRTKETYSDRLGHFEIGQFVGCVPNCPELELILEKTGYQTKYVNLSGDAEQRKGVTIELIPTNKPQENIWNNHLGNILYYLSMMIAGLGLVTLIMVFIVKVDNKRFWFAVVFFGTINFHYNFLADNFDLKLLRPVTQFNPPHFRDPAWYKFCLPIGMITFWTYYISHRKKTVDKKHNKVFIPPTSDM